MVVRVILAVAALSACAQAANYTLISNSALSLVVEENTDGSRNIVLQRRGATETIAQIGRQVGTQTATSTATGGTLNVVFADTTTLAISTKAAEGERSGYIVSVTWNSLKDIVLEDCANLGLYHWYGGPQQKHQYWPIERLSFNEYSYVTKEADNCGVAERYWLSSAGTFFYLDKKVPLFIDQNYKYRRTTCFIAKVKSPYSSAKRTRNVLIYSIGIFNDVREAHEYAVATYLGKPSGIPNEKMITYPIWSTWAKYKSAIDHDVVMEFANAIISNGFPKQSQYEIDDLWEICYGSETVNVGSFPDMKGTISALKAIGYRVTMWAHPFINKNCLPWYTDATTAAYVVLSEDGVSDTSWWNNNGTLAAYIDFTKSAAKNWYINRLKTLQTSIGVDGYKFDAGESSWSPLIPVLQGDIEEQPNLITTEYVKAVSEFGDLVEVRAGFMTQDLPIFIRMIDKDSKWGFENGLSTLITTTFQLNMNGYTLVLPDMVGGNGYEGAPSKELFIRWLQANTFMPSIQFSYVPWDYDAETVTISKKFVALHEQYAPDIIAAFKRSVSDGTPVNPPIWWIAPNDTQAQAIWDEYLLGETILVAPVVAQNAVTRSIYLPQGTWMDQGDPDKLVVGPVWLTNYSAPLDTLPFFVLKGGQASLLASVCLVLLALAASFYVNYE